MPIDENGIRPNILEEAIVLKQPGEVEAGVDPRRDDGYEEGGILVGIGAKINATAAGDDEGRRRQREIPAWEQERFVAPVKDAPIEKE